VRAGVILAGGRSTRFGERDKALAELDGTPMIRRVATRVDSVVDDLVVNCRDAQVAPLAAALDGMEPTFARDDRPDEGPLAGIATGLRTTRARYAAVVACDMPFVDPDFVDFLFSRASGRDAAIPRPDEWLQPIQAVYRTDAMAGACERALARGDRRPVDPLSDLDAVVVGRAEIERHTTARTFENLNTPAEFDAAAQRL
jgi:molybdopterin-guanine dinucleotide biosynthesis protein A